jgi:hypothetical protein
MINRNKLGLLLSILVTGCCGCGAPQYAKMSMTLNPRTGEVSYWTQQETSLVLGQITASDDNGVKSLTVGTTTQPAFSYGSEAQGVMAQYAIQQAQYTIMLDTVGKNLIGQIDSIGNAAGQVLGGLAGIRAAAAASEPSSSSLLAQCDSAATQITSLTGQLASLKALAESLSALQKAQAKTP